MGYPTDPDPIGDDCLCCWPANKTPSTVFASFVGIKPCDKPFNGIPQPINDVIQLWQDAQFPCYFEAAVDNWLTVWDSCKGATSVISQSWGINEYFLHNKIGNCWGTFENKLNCAGPIIYGHNGLAGVMWNLNPTDHSIGSLMNSINMEPHAKTKFEFWPASEERICIRFARKSDATNILILVEPTEL